MSDGHASTKGQVDVIYVTMDAEEFNRVCQRVNELLVARAESAYEKKRARPSERNEESYVEASKDVYAFCRMAELIERMSDEIYELRQELSAYPDDVSEVVGVPKKKEYFN